MTTQPGWHPDPAPQQPGGPPQLRWWDGARWTEHTTPVPDQYGQPEQHQQGQQQEQQQQPAPYAGRFGGGPADEDRPANPYGGASYGASPYGVGPYPGTPYAQPGGRTTPDGVPLSGWWWRVLALIIDSLILGTITMIVALPWVRDLIHDYRTWFDAAMDTSRNGGTVDTAELQRQTAKPVAIIAGVQLAVGFVYTVGFLMWRQATPGKLACGLRVRLRERPGPMPLGTVLLRWLGQYGVGVLGLVPLVGAVSGLYTLLDYLWPLWDDKNQAIHDKIARTNVVRPPRR